MGVARRPLMVGLIAALLLGHGGCGTTTTHQVPSEDLRGRAGTLAVARPVMEKVGLAGPIAGKGEGAAKGAEVAAGSMIVGGLYAGAQSGHPYGFAAGVALGFGLAPIAAVVGAIHGAITAEPAERVQEAERALKDVFAGLDVPAALHGRVVQIARAEAALPVVSLANQPDTILEISVPVLGLVGPAGANPRLALVVEMCARLIRAVDGAVLYTLPPDAHTLTYIGPGPKFVEWAADDARLFREEIERAYAALAEKVVEELFLVHPLPGRRWATTTFTRPPGRCQATAEKGTP